MNDTASILYPQTNDSCFEASRIAVNNRLVAAVAVTRSCLLQGSACAHLL